MFFILDYSNKKPACQRGCLCYFYVIFETYEDAHILIDEYIHCYNNKIIQPKTKLMCKRISSTKRIDFLNVFQYNVFIDKLKFAEVVSDMKRYVALLRGINISGKNKVSMAELKKGFEILGFEEVKTYLNSGNVIFSSDEYDIQKITKQIGAAIKSQFGFDIPVFVILKEKLEDILHHAPDWWGTDNKEIYDNLIFIMPPVTFVDVYNEVGEPKEELEKIKDYKETVFWSFSRKNYQKTNWWSNTASANISTKLTIRTANTVRKIVSM